MNQGEMEDDIYNQVENSKKEKIHGILERLNRSLGEIQPLWPQATKLELYIAFGKCYNDPNQLVIDIEDKQFKDYIKDASKELIEQTSSCKHTKSSKNSTIHSSMFNRAADQNDDSENEEEEKDDENSKDDDSDFENDYDQPRRWNLRRSTRITTRSESQRANNNDDEGNGQVPSENNTNNANQQNNSEENDNYNDESDESDDDDFSYNYKGPSLTHKQVKKKSQSKKSSERSSKKKTHKEQENIDLPRPKEIKLADWETWSFAHKQSYLKGAKNANAYYYRNLKQGEKARNGKWTPEETKLFMNRIKVMSKKNFYESTPQWGIFSMAIPGRVGYQCANYYRNLVQEGKIYDPRYKIIDGKLKYIAFHQKENKRSKSRSKSKNTYDDNDNYDNNGDLTDETKNLSIYERYARENPLIGAIDGITKEPIRVPAISPDGYLLDYNTWLKIISQTGADPYTTNHITKRSLVVLNFDNIEEYRDKIKNLVME